MLPFTAQTISHDINGECVPFAAYEAGKKPFWLCQLTEDGFVDSDSLRANTPYIISMPENDGYSPYYRLAGTVTFSARQVVVPPTQLNVSRRGQASFVPTLSKADASEQVFTLNVGEERYDYPQGSLFIANYRDCHPFHAYRTTTQAGVRLLPIANDLPRSTGIGRVTAVSGTATGEAVYNLTGMRITKPLKKGIYIYKGRKVKK